MPESFHSIENPPSFLKGDFSDFSFYLYIIGTIYTILSLHMDISEKIFAGQQRPLEKRLFIRNMSRFTPPENITLE